MEFILPSFLYYHLCPFILLTIQDNFQCCDLLIKYQDSQLGDYQGSQEPARRLPKLIEGPASRALLIKYQDSQLGDYQGSQEPARRLPNL